MDYVAYEKELSFKFISQDSISIIITSDYIIVIYWYRIKILPFLLTELRGVYDTFQLLLYLKVGIYNKMRSISPSRFIDLHDIQKQQCVEFTYAILCFYSFNYQIKNVSIFVNRHLYVNGIFVELETKNNDASSQHHNRFSLNIQRKNYLK